MQEEKVTAESVAAWLRELGYRSPDGSLPTRNTVAGAAHAAPDMLQFLMERFRSKAKAQKIRQYVALLDASSDPLKAETLKRLNETAKLNQALKEATRRREAKAEQYAQGVVRGGAGAPWRPGARRSACRSHRVVLRAERCCPRLPAGDDAAGDAGAGGGVRGRPAAAAGAQGLPP
jgi:hypothetical protein